MEVINFDNKMKYKTHCALAAHEYIWEKCDQDAKQQLVAHFGDDWQGYMAFLNKFYEKHGPGHGIDDYVFDCYNPSACVVHLLSN